MAIQIQGNAGTVAEVDGTTYRAVRTVARPYDYGSLGAYGFGAFTGILPAALGANSEIFQFRWPDATRFAIINSIVIAASVSTTFFAAGVPVQIDLVKATSWSAQGTGGNALTPASLLKKRTSMGSSLLTAGDLRIASTAALGIGTKTLEGSSVAALAAAGPITASLAGTIIPPFTPLWQSNTMHGQAPFVLAQNEGLVIRCVAVPATGTWTASIQVDWTEVTAF